MRHKWLFLSIRNNWRLYWAKEKQKNEAKHSVKTLCLGQNGVVSRNVKSWKKLVVDKKIAKKQTMNPQRKLKSWREMLLSLFHIYFNSQTRYLMITQHVSMRVLHETDLSHIKFSFIKRNSRWGTLDFE